ncbi:hypothetical protein [Streptomyces sp. 5-10]|uniref:hypothetical protein n=1 Tax=Streptomyces sp. 5-10 TaxID=878925 RepID=UPI00168AFE16|nr:hypothetical protein [Streptomyces sp. 5-10]MBD3003925.1 hypothetical protein [Streptomyces sp. 5-10]
MLPTEPPLSLHRLLAPVPPARPQEVAAATHQTPAPAPAPAKPPTPAGHLLVAGQNQVGNAAVAEAAARTNPSCPPPTGTVVLLKPKAAQPS